MSEGGVALRFIIDPLAWSKESIQSGLMAISHARQWGDLALAPLLPVIEQYDGERGGFFGNFRLWLGVGVGSDGDTSGKIYMNPYLFDSDHELSGVHKFLLTSGFGADLVQPLSEVVETCGYFRPHIVGINLNESGITSIKIYLILPDPSINSLMALARTRTALATRLMHLLPYLSVSRGQVHLTLGFSRAGGEPKISLQFMASHWFGSPRVGVSAADELFRRDGVDMKAVQEKLISCTFVGVSESASFMYVA